jgi:hypothetical protein
MDDEQGIWTFDDQARSLLLRATEGLPELRSVIGLAERQPALDNRWEVTASLEDLNDLYTLVEQLIDQARSRKQREMLDGLRFSLSAALDGF